MVPNRSVALYPGPVATWQQPGMFQGRVDVISTDGGTMLRITARLSLLFSARSDFGEPPHAKLRAP
jgi:hypothetical protein